MSFTATGHRHLGTVWKSKTICWNWLALNIGTAQPGRDRRWNYRAAHWLWQFHVPPLHVSRVGSQWYVGLCWGARTIYLHRHR